MEEAVIEPSTKGCSSGVGRKGQRTVRACDFCRLKKAKALQEVSELQNIMHLQPPSEELEATVDTSVSVLVADDVQATLIKCVETLHRRLRVEKGGSAPASEPTVNDIILSLGLDPIDNVEIDTEDATIHFKSHSSPSASDSPPTSIETPPMHDTLELRDTLEQTQPSALLPEPTYQDPVQLPHQAMNNGGGGNSWKGTPQYYEMPLVEDDMFGTSSFTRDLTPGPMKPWAGTPMFDTSSFPCTYDLFDNGLNWNT
ncbi:hypothetical protein KCU88_g259, partial [Aureobasidium melanogenum]